MLSRAADDNTEPVLAAKGLCIAHNVHGKAPVGSEQSLCADIARNLLDAAQQQVFHLVAVLVGQQPFIRAQPDPDFLFVFFPDNMRIGVAATQICGMVGFCCGKTRIRAFEPFQTVTQAMLATLMLGIQRFQLAQNGGKLHLHEYERIAGCGSLHFRRVGGLALDIVNHALQQVLPGRTTP